MITRYILFVLLATVASALIACADKCTGVNCGPAPPVLQVVVKDTVTIDTTTIHRTVIDSVVVTLQRVVGIDTVAFDTLKTISDSTFIKTDVVGLPSTEFLIKAERHGRHVFYGGAKLQQVEGCCSYSVVGFYTLGLPETP